MSLPLLLRQDESSYMPLPRLTTVAGLFAAVLLATPFIPAAAQDGRVLDEIVAIVGDEIILQSEVDALLSNLMRQQPQATYSDEVWMQALDQIINQHVLTVVAKRDTNITVTQEEVDQVLEQRINQLIQQVGGQARLEDLYGKSLVRIRADLHNEFRDQLLAEKLQQTKVRNIRVTPTEVREWFAQFPTDSLPTIPELVRVAHIVRYPDLTEEAIQEAYDIISAIRDSIVSGGADLEEMARQFSDDPGSAAAGGRIEDTNLADLVPEFAAVASRSPVGEISQVFRTTFGFHILRVNERRGENVDFNHILIRIDDRRIDPTPTIAFLNSVRDSVLNQQIPFAVMAKRHSQEERSAQLGGRVIDPQTGERDLVLENLGELWRATLDTMRVGDISRATRVDLEDDRQAYHIVELQRRVPEHTVALDTDYERIEQFALQEKRARVLQAWVNQLREDVYVDLRGRAEQLALAQR